MFFIILYSNKKPPIADFLQECVIVTKGGLIYLTLFFLEWEIYYANP